MADGCGAEGMVSLMGKPADSIRAAGIAQPYRIIPLGGIVTQDFNENRLNFHLDARGNLIRVTCG